MNVLAASDLPTLLEALQRRGYTTVGPTVRDGAITLDTIGSVDDLPAGWDARSAPGRYDLERRGDGAWLTGSAGPHSLKRFLFPPEETLFSLRRNGDGLTFASPTPSNGNNPSQGNTDDDEAPAAPNPISDAPRYAFLGVRACDLAALAVLDEVLLGREYTDPRYRARREAAFLVAVQCTEAGETCFCASMGTGPAVAAGAGDGTGDTDDGAPRGHAEATTPTDHRQAVPDLVLTELGAGTDDHRFLLDARTDAGRELADDLPARPATTEDREAAREGVEEAARSMGRRLDAAAAPALLRAHPDHPRWDEVARRCLTCGNCTLVCPTCFCHTVAERPSLDGATGERVRRWDSCFNVDHSYLHGGSVRTSPRSRYRQWLTHKLSTWKDQFGTLGCVGCGRCITWCPVGIDLTEEVAAIGASATGDALRPGG